MIERLGCLLGLILLYVWGVLYLIYAHGTTPKKQGKK